MGNRHYIYVPEINPDTFVFFFFKGTTGRSYSVRDYSHGFENRRDARSFSWTADEILRMARRPGSHRVDAPTHSTSDVGFHRRRIEELNARHLGVTDSRIVDGTPEDEPATPDTVPDPVFPMLDLDRFHALPKANKGQDVARMYTSPRSEDYVTWNVMTALQRAPVSAWWPGLVRLASTHAVDGVAMPEVADAPAVELWRKVPSPPAYEAASRERMRSSGNALWVARAGQPDPVEGTSEIDVVFDGTSYLVFVEAKLDSDVSTGTTHDPDRNQIARNIDCVMEQAGDRLPCFWMIVRDRGPLRTYTQLIDGYRTDPTSLQRLLPHRDPDDVASVVNRIAVLTWDEIAPLLPPADTADGLAVYREVGRRTGATLAGGEDGAGDGLGPRFDEALTYAHWLHREQRRKGTTIPYVSHLMAVAATVLEMGGGEDEAIAALLHDAVEDQGGAPTLAEIERRFGAGVASIVEACSDTDQDPKPPWRARKEEYLAHLEDAPEPVLRVSLADKLHNARAVLRDHRTHGDDLWQRFNAGADDQIWYYQSLLDVFSRRLPGPFTDEFADVVGALARGMSGA